MARSKSDHVPIGTLDILAPARFAEALLSGLAGDEAMVAAVIRRLPVLVECVCAGIRTLRPVF